MSVRISLISAAVDGASWQQASWQISTGAIELQCLLISGEFTLEIDVCVFLLCMIILSFHTRLDDRFLISPRNNR